MNGPRWLLATTMLAAVATVGQAQGRGGQPPMPPMPPAGRGQVLTQQQRDAIQKLRAQQQKERIDFRAKQRDQFEKALPPEARQRLAQRQQRLIREGRQLERAQRGRGGRAGLMQACTPQGPGAAALRRQGRGGPPPMVGGGGRGRGGAAQQGVGPQRGMGPGCLNPGMQNGMQNGMGPGRGGMRGRGGFQPPPPPPFGN